MYFLRVGFVLNRLISKEFILGENKARNIVIKHLTNKIVRYGNFFFVTCLARFSLFGAKFNTFRTVLRWRKNVVQNVVRLAVQNGEN